jgi:separase
LWTKLERLAEFYKQAGRFDELLNTLVALRDELIDQGYLAAVADMASSKPLSIAWTQNDEISALRRSIHSIIKVEIKCFKTSKLSQFIGLPWTKEQHAVVLEDQLQTMSSFSNNDLARGVSVHYCRQLVDIYSEIEYPVRRLRVLLHLFLLDYEESRDVLEDLPLELKQCCQEEIVIDGTKDSGLKAYFENLRTTTEANLELRLESPNVGVIKQAISRWTRLRERCTTMSELEAQVDDVSSLLLHLQSISDWLNVQGHSSVRLATLRLIAEINEMYDISHRSSELVQCFSNLGAQWLVLGYSGKAGMSFEKAKELSRGNGVSSDAMLQLYLSYAQYLLTVDNNEKWYVYVIAGLNEV